jgi:hypothetical protein
MTENISDYSEGILGAIQHVASEVPVIGELIAGYDAYSRARFNREAHQFLAYLNQKTDNIGVLLSEGWLKTEEGQQYWRKVVDSALDAQMEDKQELFANALINGIENRQLSQLERLKFVDILRHVSRASLMVLADMHNMFKDQVRGPGRKPAANQPYPVVDSVKIATTLAGKYDPFLVDACIQEMQSEGLFSNIAEWQQPGAGIAPQGLADVLTYNHFTAKFVEFVTLQQPREGGKEV